MLKGIPKHQLCFVGKEQLLLPLTAAGVPGPRWTFTLHPIPPVSVDQRLIPNAENFSYLRFGLLTHSDPLTHLGLCRRQERRSLVCCAPSCWRQRASLGSWVPSALRETKSRQLPSAPCRAGPSSPYALIIPSSTFEGHLLIAFFMVKVLN